MPLYVSSRFSVSPVCSSLCVFPLHYLTCPLPSSLTSPVPRLVISVSVFGLCPPSCLLQGLHPSEEHLNANYVTTLREGCPNLKAPTNAAHKCGLLFPVFGGCTATILRGLTYPNILL